MVAATTGSHGYSFPATDGVTATLEGPALRYALATRAALPAVTLEMPYDSNCQVAQL